MAFQTVEKPFINLEVSSFCDHARALHVPAQYNHQHLRVRITALDEHLEPDELGYLIQHGFQGEFGLRLATY
jgi:hypothetical protein